MDPRRIRPASPAPGRAVRGSSSATGRGVAEVSGLVDLSAWPAGTRLILRKERPQPGAQLRITDPILRRVVVGQVAQAGVLAVADAVLNAGVAAVAQFQVGQLAAGSTGGGGEEAGDPHPVVVGGWPSPP